MAGLMSNNKALFSLERPRLRSPHYKKCKILCAAAPNEKGFGLIAWMRSARPHQILGLPDSRVFSQEDVKAAFRSKVKEYHPDVYRGADAEAITQCLIRAYEQLLADSKPGTDNSDTDPFEEPEGEDNNIFVNEIVCLGRECPYSCVRTAPSVFQYSNETGSARAIVQGRSYEVDLAKGQCPRSCIHYVTAEQRKILEEFQQSAFSDPYTDYLTVILGLVGRAEYENRRRKGSKPPQ